MHAAPADEILPVIAIGLEGVGRLGPPRVVLRLVSDAVESRQRANIAVGCLAVDHLILSFGIGAERAECKMVWRGVLQRRHTEASLRRNASDRKKAAGHS